MKRAPEYSRFAIAMVFIANAATAAVPQQARALIDHLTGGKGTYAADDGVYKVIFPREEATIVQDYQSLSPNLGLNSWVAFTSAIHHDALVTGQFLLLEDEVNPVITVALESGLDVTGLAALPLFEGRLLQILDVTGTGTFDGLASAFRKSLDEIRRVRRTATLRPTKFVGPPVPLESAIDCGPLDTVLSLRGVVIGGVYRVAIGNRAVLHGELIGREMGMSTWVSFAGTNDHALAHGEFVETPDGLKILLKALQAKGINIVSIRNHTLGEHPQFVFVGFWGQDSALELAKKIRYVLDTQVPTIPRA